MVTQLSFKELNEEVVAPTLGEFARARLHLKSLLEKMDDLKPAIKRAKENLEFIETKLEQQIPDEWADNIEHDDDGFEIEDDDDTRVDVSLNGGKAITTTMGKIKKVANGFA